MTRLSAWARRALAVTVTLVAVATVLSTTAEQPTPAPAPAPALELAADTSQFDAGNIISDAMFFDPGAMTAGEIADFLHAKGASCRVGKDGSPCLKNFSMATTNRAADNLCAGYTGAARESAAVIIARVAAACRVSPKVLLVLLQKEMGFITTTNPTAKMYERAAGYACPDNGTGKCDPAYAGLQNQLYRSAWQYQRYAAYPQNYAYRAGRDNRIQWDVPASCGTSMVYIKNQATAGLYNYTPYRPNAAALRAGYGYGDDCSAYGNRNFWLYFTDWFGSTQSPGGDAIVAAYASRGGAAGVLGPQTSSVRCGFVFSGCLQTFQKGYIYYSPGSGAHAVLFGPIWDAWGARGYEKSLLGYPIADQNCTLVNGGCLQSFQTGVMYWSPTTGAHVVRGAIGDRWAKQKWETGPLGYPLMDELCGLVKSGCLQTFQGGTVYWSPATGSRVVTKAVLDAWGTRGWEKGTLGYPTTELMCGLKDGGCGQVFQGGRVYTSPATGAHAVAGPFATAWGKAGFEQGALGYPAGGEVCGLADDGCRQAFQGGTLYSHPDSGGAFPVTGAMAATWTAQGAEGGALGYPLTKVICGLADGGCGQVFQNGRIYTTPLNGTRAVVGPLATAWAAHGFERGPMGYPVADRACNANGTECTQAFQGGTLTAHPTAGMQAVPTTTASVWSADGGGTGALGYPLTGLICGLSEGGCGQVFQGGRIYSTPATGTRAVSGPIATAWGKQGFELGALGYPTGDRSCDPAGTACTQAFQGGSVVTHPTAGTHVLGKAVVAAWTAQGGVGGALGYPTTRQICGLKDGGCGQVFQGGRIYTTKAHGTRAVSGPIATAWAEQGFEQGKLGYPVADATRVPGSTSQQFQGGTLVLDEATGTVTRR